jgi:hypothetical protein
MAERYNHCHGAADRDVNRLRDVISASLSVCADDHGPLEVYIRQHLDENTYTKIGVWIKCRADTY